MGILRFLLLTLLVPSSVPAQSQSAPLIPVSLRRFLNRRYPAWHFAKIPDEIHKSVRESSATARPDFISGDFDGDGRTDYAVYIVYGPTAQRRIAIIAIFRRGRSCRSVNISTGGYNPSSEISVADGAGYLALDKRGTKLYDYGCSRFFTLKQDAIFVGIYNKAGSTFIYEGGRFREVLTSD